MSELNKEYSERIQKAVMEAIIQTPMLKSEGSPPVVAVLSGEVVDVCISIIAMFASGSDETATPKKLREFADVFARKLRSRVRTFQEMKANGEPTPWTDVNDRNRN